MNLIPPSGLVFDIGAHLGESAIRFLDAGARSVVCVEPVLANYLRIPERPEIIKIHAAAWHDNMVQLVHPALSDSAWSSLNPAHWEKTKPGVKWGAPETVAAITIDAISTRFTNPDIVKIDAEGSEPYILSGMSFKPKTVIFEFCNVHMDDALSCLERLRNLGFTFGWYELGQFSLEERERRPIEAIADELCDLNPRSGNITVQ